MFESSQGGSGPPFDIHSLIDERSTVSEEKSIYKMSQCTGDPNVAAKTVLTALAGLTAALTATMIIIIIIIITIITIIILIIIILIIIIIMIMIMIMILLQSRLPSGPLGL